MSLNQSAKATAKPQIKTPSRVGNPFDPSLQLVFLPLCHHHLRYLLGFLFHPHSEQSLDLQYWCLEAILPIQHLFIDEVHLSSKNVQLRSCCKGIWKLLIPILVQRKAWRGQYRLIPSFGKGNNLAATWLRKQNTSTYSSCLGSSTYISTHLSWKSTKNGRQRNNSSQR